MPASLNRTRVGRRSVWTVPWRFDDWQIAAITAGAIVGAWAWRSRSRGRVGLAALGLGGVALGLCARPVRGRVGIFLDRRERDSPAERVIDEALEDSFPASDPPSFTAAR